jgi:LmbE family N-acetylglucosaminyl deacetylase
MSGPVGFVSPGALAAPARHLVLSPHYDDVALSCGGTVAQLTRAGRTPDVALVFAAAPDPTLPLTPFARRMHDGWGLEADAVIAARRAEERRAAALLGARIAFLPFPDAIYRGERYLDDEALFGRLATEEVDLVEAIVAALDLPAEVDGETRLYAPLGIGGHVDHQLVYQAGLALARAGWAVWWYEDLPYALRAGAAERRAAAVAERFEVAAVVDVETVWSRKVDAILCYPSQLATIFSDLATDTRRGKIDAVMRRYAEATGGGRVAERFWRLPKRSPGRAG